MKLWIVGLIASLAVTSAIADQWQAISSITGNDGHVTDAYAIDLASIHAQGKYMMVTALLVHVGAKGAKTAITQTIGIDCKEAMYYIESESTKVISGAGKVLSNSPAKAAKNPEPMTLENAGPVVEPQETPLYDVIAQVACGDISN